MKRSLAMTLAAVGAGAFGIWAFTASGSTKSAHGKIYTSVGACVTDGVVGAATCQTQWQRSLVLHVDKAPSYATAAACEVTHGPGRCMPAANASDPARRGLYVPVMSGYVMGKLATGGYQSAPLYKLKADETNKHRMSAAPEPVKDAQGRSISAFVWMSRSVRPVAASSAGRSLWGNQKPSATSAGASRAVARGAAPAAARGGFGGANRGGSAAG